MRFLRAILFLSVPAILIFPYAASSQWVQSNGPYGAAVTSFVVNGSTIYAGTSKGVYRASPASPFWIQRFSGLATASTFTSTTINTLAVSGGDLFAGTNNGLYRSTNQGSSWIETIVFNGGLPIYCIAVSGTNLYIGTNFGVYRTTNSGSSWSAVNPSLTNSVTSLAVSGSLLFAGTSSGVFLSTNNGAGWTPVNTGLTNTTVTALSVSGTNLFAGTGIGLFLSNNNGTSWTQVTTGFPSVYVNDLAVSGANLFAGTAAGVYLSTNGGTNWTAVNQGLTYPVVDALAVSAPYIFAGTGKGIFQSTNNGSSWTAVNNGLTDITPKGFVAIGSNLIAGLAGGSVYLSTDNGSNWTQSNEGFGSYFALALAVSGTNLFAATFAGPVFLSTNNGATWIATGPVVSTPNAVRTLAASGTNLFVGYSGGVHRSTNNGASWAQANSGFLTSSTVVNAISTVGANVFAGTNRGVYLSTNSGTSWTLANAGVGESNVAALAASGPNLFAGTYFGGVFLSTNNGTTWSSRNAGFGEREISTLAVSGSVMLAGTSKGLYVSTNSGARWVQTNARLADTGVVAVAMLGPNLLASGATAGTWRMPFSALSTFNPSIVSIKDIPFDQGGRVELLWNATILDTSVTALPKYSIWRAVPRATLGTAPSSASATVQSVSLDLLKIRTVSTTAGTFAWEWLGDSPAHLALGYSYYAPTRYDSTSASKGVHYFMVSAQTSDPNTFYDSEPDSGYSVDNIAPRAPILLTADRGSSGIALHWRSNTEADLMSYVVLRSESPITDPGSMTAYGSTVDTVFVDRTPLTKSAYYVVRAKDVHDNVGAVSNQVTVLATGVEDQTDGLPATFDLKQNYPNPFNPSTTISYQLPASSHATLAVFDLLGRRIAMLVDEERGAGVHSTTWNATDEQNNPVSSGVYVYRLTTASLTLQKRMLLVR